MNPEAYREQPWYRERQEEVWQTGRPWIIGKAAMSRNGKMTRPPGEGQWITGPKARSDVQRLRAQCDAILIGAETARQDDPQLTVREFEVSEQPWRVVVTRSGNLPTTLKLFVDEYKDRTLIMQSKSWQEIWPLLFEKGIRVVLVEGGGVILNELAEAAWIDESVIYQTSFDLVGEALVAAEQFRQLSLEKIQKELVGQDEKISGLVMR